MVPAAVPVPDFRTGRERECNSWPDDVQGMSSEIVAGALRFESFELMVSHLS